MKHLLVLLGGAALALASVAARRPQPRSDRARRTVAVRVVAETSAPRVQILEASEEEEDDCRDPDCSECLRPGS